ncbi:hypothetical protein [Lacticaseibacillus paracasei]|uniref:hypothetical protein n=1 Tax=Lacticaseibacillus paracasei TaxID=1597 RepID=UPI0008DD367D|nr:hypothetical protein [Lacticaseibacillus paracasei]OHY44411.1 hypothetical protein BBX46_14635 [Lacticaseibacillus paracasei]QPC20661.1 hypothetical protein LacP0625_08345 [Lacticaseibacillus paracasei subsp. tolerans]
MNGNDDDFKDNVEYLAPGEQPMGQILTPETVIESSLDLMEYRQLINSNLLERGCDNWLISIECAELNVEALNHLVDEVEDAGWHVALGGKTLNIH